MRVCSCLVDDPSTPDSFDDCETHAKQGPISVLVLTRIDDQAQNEEKQRMEEGTNPSDTTDS